MKWEIEISSKSSGKENMEKDISMLSDLKSPKVRIYGWSNNCVSLGYSQNPDEEIDLEKAKIHNIEIVKRPTGGGIVFHNTDEVTYCVAAPVECFPKGIKASYFFISEIILKALDRMGVKAQINSREKLQITKYKVQNTSRLCFSHPQDYEITYKGKKLVGSAQKRNRKFVLQQGTIAISRPEKIFLEVLKDKEEISKYCENITTVQKILGENISFSKIANVIAKEFAFYV